LKLALVACALRRLAAAPSTAKVDPATLFAHACSRNSLALRVWTWAVGTGSSLAVGVCRGI